MYNLSKLKLLARGGQAEIYEIDEEKVLRVLRNPEDEKYLKAEMSIMHALKAKGKDVPAVYEYLRVNDMPAIVIERIYGMTMLDDIKKNPIKLFKQAEKLANLHINIADSSTGLGLLSIKQRAAFLIPRAEMLNADSRAFALKVLEELEEGNEICHGDFHPGNILISNGKYFVIDWFGATSGRKISDIAHTYLLLKIIPRIPGMSRFQYDIMKLFGRILADRYLKSCYKLSLFDWGELSRWMVVRAAERVFYGLPSEKAALIKFIEKCMVLSISGSSNTDTWWKIL
jgi:hypothetical protein